MGKKPAFAIYPSLADKVVVISGGATGIGASMVEAFTLQGAEVIILDILDSAANQLITSLSEKRQAQEQNNVSQATIGHIPSYIHCDVTDIHSSLRPAAVQILARHPRIDAVINNAASDTRRPTADITPEEWNLSLGVNLSHHFFLTQALLPGLLLASDSADDEGGGSSASVINMGSIVWSIPGTQLAPYIASKSAIVGLTRTLAHELGPKGVRVNSIMPGAIATERQRRDVLTPEYEAEVLGRQALKRLLQPEEVSRLALWLVADDSSGVTNQSIVVDAGWT